MPFAENDVGDKGIQALTDALKSNKTVEALRLDSASGCFVLASSWRRAVKFVGRVAENRIGDDGAQALAES